MKLFICAFLGATISLCAQEKTNWTTKEAKIFKIHFTDEDKNLTSQLETNLETGSKNIAAFFSNSFVKPFDVFVFPHRTQLDAQWQKDWDAPDFKSECWMVASGVAHRFDLLSPNAWGKEACEHNAADRLEVQQIITHELTHVFHGQHNAIPDFTGMDDLAWLIEGVATYASGQLDEKRLVSVKKIVEDGKAPTSLAKFWSGKDKYGLAGSLVKYVDVKIGRKQLFELLKETKQEAILSKLGLTEAQLIEEWKDFLKK